MVFRGRLSKACQRCRERRLRCDFKTPSCSSCVRASLACVGYRDTVTIRIADETDHVRIKAIARGAVVSSSSILYPPPDIEATGRDIFFAHYVCNFSQTWSVLLKYRNSITAPEHLALSLDAVSLAFMVHHTGSAFAKALSWKKYLSALRKINAELQDPDSARRASTFEGAMVLDLFEKMSKSLSETTERHHAHVKGALALVKLRGVESFQKGPELRSLLGLSLNVTICCLTMRRKVPDEVRTIRGHASTFVNTTGMRWNLSGAMIDVADLIAEIHAETLTLEEKMIRCAALDSRLEAIAREARPESAYECFVLPREQRSGTLPEDSPPLYHIYPNRTVAQIWNVLRLIRILLYEEFCSHFDTPSHSATHSPPPLFITPTIQQICASVPQTTSCTFAATSKLAPGCTCQPTTLRPASPRHTIPHVLDAYMLVFPLYVAAWSRHCPAATRTWVLQQLEHIASHFGVAEARIVRGILLRDMQTDSAEESWYVTPSSRKPLYFPILDVEWRDRHRDEVSLLVGFVGRFVRVRAVKERS